MDAVDEFERVVREEEEFFDEDVAETINNAPAVPPPHISSADAIEETLNFPKDEMADLDPVRPRSFWLGTVVNSIWRTFLQPPSNLVEAEWRRVLNRLEPHADTVITWLKDFINRNEEGHR